MSSEYNHEQLETLQKSYRCAWTSYAAEVECLQSAQENGEGEHTLAQIRVRVEQAAAEYRVARDQMALFLLDQTALLPEYVAESERQPELAIARSA